MDLSTGVSPFIGPIIKHTRVVILHTLQQRDENGTLVFILPDVQNSESLYALRDFLYTGQALFHSDQVKADLDLLLAVDIKVSLYQSIPKREGTINRHQQVWSLMQF